jgi:hypothetical protein
VEHLVGYAKRDLIVPAAPAVSDLMAANRLAAVWCAEVNAVVHSEICAVPVARLEQERGLFGELPSLRPEIGARPASRKVDKLSCVRFGSARYSVPSRVIGTTGAIAMHGTKIRVLEPFTGEIAAEHGLAAPGEASIADEHYGSARPDKPRRTPRPRTDGKKQFLALGQTASVFWPALPRPGLPTLPREISEIPPCRPPTARPPSSRHCNGRCSSAGGGPVTCARSWPRPAPRRSPAPPGRHWCSPCRPCRSAAERLRLRR